MDATANEPVLKQVILVLLSIMLLIVLILKIRDRDWKFVIFFVVGFIIVRVLLSH
jgi:hypothetical protein